MPYKDKEKQKEYQRLWMKSRREEWFKENGPCLECGSTEELEIDHINPEHKITHRVWSWSLERRTSELAKCRVLCRKCHDKRHEAAHGTRHKAQRGCECDPCLEAKRKYDREYMKMWRAHSQQKDRS